MATYALLDLHKLSLSSADAVLCQHLVPPAEAQEQSSSPGQGSHQQQPPEQREVAEQQEGAVQDAGHLDVAPATNRCGRSAAWAVLVLHGWAPPSAI